MISNGARKELAEQQEQLLNALLGLEPAPSEVDSHQVEVCGLSLKQKRIRVLSKLSGVSDTACGASSNLEMEAYFKIHPGVHPEGGYADLKRYKKFLARKKFMALFGMS